MAAQQGKNKNNAKLPDLITLLKAGIDPKTKLPIRMEDDENLKTAIKLALSRMDEQDAVNRYVWHNLPVSLSSQELERLIYLRYDLVFFYCEPLDEYYFMPYALDGGLDYYGRYVQVHPIPFTNGTDEKDKAAQEVQAQYLSTLKLKVYYDIPTEDMSLEDIDRACVILKDYTQGLGQSGIPSVSLTAGIIDVMADCFPFMRTALQNSTGISGMRVNTQDEYSNVLAANKSINKAALNGEKYIPIIAAVEMQELTGKETGRAEDFLLAMQSLDNFRLSLYGLNNGGLFQKKSHMLEAEQKVNDGNVGIILQDGLAIRQRFCDIANSIFGTLMSVEIAETAGNIDYNGDGLLLNEQDQSGTMPGEQDATGMEDMNDDM